MSAPAVTDSPEAPLRRRLQAEMLRLCELSRDSARAGEHQAAQIVRDQLAKNGIEAEITRVPAVGNYWLPLGAASLIGAVCALAPGGGRLARLGLSALALSSSIGVAQDISAGSRWIRAPFRRRRAHNVSGSAESASETQSEQTIVFCSHHDAAPAGLIFHPAIPRLAHKIAPRLMEANSEGPPVMFPVVAAPAIAALGRAAGSRSVKWAGAGLSLLMCLIFLDVALRRTVPGANDNASGVIALSELARRLTESPLKRTRVIYLSTGSEESMLEGMTGFAREHFPQLDPRTTLFVCLDTVGSPELCVLEGEGMLRMRRYPDSALQLASRAASESGVSLLRGLKHRNSTDALYPLRAGYPTLMIGSVNELRTPANYHWWSDTEENLDYSSIEDAITLCERISRIVDDEGVPSEPVE